ncbi:MAG TPA: hypothetical protein VM305_04690 [Candidatus Limnocylindrales bacterium]|nr:hypothetical protein [Candidatus Limnocylindrales bacterium]
MLTDALRGAVAGAVATWVMDQVTTAMLKSQPDEATRREEEARPNGKSAIANLVDRVESVTGFEADGKTRPRVESAVHYGLGIVPGALYGLLRRRVPLLGAGGGLVFGALLWALNDEWLNSQLGLSGPLDAYPAVTHWRGFVGHAVLGAMTESTIELLGG